VTTAIATAAVALLARERHDLIAHSLTVSL
jgi:hypothetical protein